MSPALTVRFSAGVAQWEPGTTKDELVRRADLALIEAKRLNQTALVYSSSFEIAVVAEPDVLRHVRVLANALARAVDTKDAYTNSHCETVAELCGVIGVELGLEEEHVFKLRLAAPRRREDRRARLDPAKARPTDVRRVRDDEGASRARRAHPRRRGAPREARWILAHHERLDGFGYPNGVTDIPLEASIIAVADAFEAMISRRPYREPRAVDEALAELGRCAGSQFDERCVAALTRVLRGEDSRLGVPTTLLSSHPLPLGAAA